MFFNKASMYEQAKKIIINEGWISSVYYIIHLLRTTAEQSNNITHVAKLSMWGRKVLDEKLNLILRRHKNINPHYFHVITNEYLDYILNEREHAYQKIFDKIRIKDKIN